MWKVIQFIVAVCILAVIFVIGLLLLLLDWKKNRFETLMDDCTQAFDKYIWNH